MLWHPKFLKGVCTTMLRRDLGRGRALEGLELRWGLVSNILHALTALGPWRLDGSEGPMHKWYDPRLFDLLSREEVVAQRATTADGEVLLNARTGEELLRLGLDARFFGDEGEQPAANGGLTGAEDADLEVEENVFRRWLERGEFVLGGHGARRKLRRTPSHLSPDDESVCKEDAEETAADLYEELRRLACDRLTARWLALRLMKEGALALGDGEEIEDLVDRVLEEVVAAANMFGDTAAGAVAQGDGNAASAAADAVQYAQSLAYG